MAETAQPTTASHSENQPAAILGRPVGQLHDFPFEIRWEITRRHPYYLVFWSDAVRFRHPDPNDHAAQQPLRQIASLMVGSIGVTGEPVDPATKFSQLLEGVADPAFLTGSVQPITLRSIAVLLINALPPAERSMVGAAIMASGDDGLVKEGDDAARNLQKQVGYARLAQLSSPALDSVASEPLFYLHLRASQRSIVRDMEDQVRRWKARKGIAESRVHMGKLPQYLSVWDRREGWTGNGYNLSLERGFADIAEELKLSPSTVANQYRTAFKMITGYEFSPPFWTRLFGPLKYSKELGDAARILSARMRHHLQSSSTRDVPDSVVTPVTSADRGVGIVQSNSLTNGDEDYRDLLMDLKELSHEGMQDDEIARRLDIDLELVANLRLRLGDFNDL